MRRLPFALVMLMAFAVAALSQTAPDAAKLTALLNEFLVGAGRNDAAVHDRFWADDLIYTRSAGVRTNKDEIMKGLRTATAPKPGDPVSTYTAEDIQIHQYGDTAVVAFRLVINTTKSDGTKTTGNNLNTGTFVKRKGLWQAVAWQSTVVPKPDAAAQTATPSTDSKPSLLVTTPATPGTRTYLKGSKGGCYYLGTNGTKVYVGHKYCN